MQDNQDFGEKQRKTIILHFSSNFFKVHFHNSLGCITRNGVGKLVVVYGNIDAVNHCDIIDKNILLSVWQYFFQHNNQRGRSIITSRWGGGWFSGIFVTQRDGK